MNSAPAGHTWHCLNKLGIMKCEHTLKSLFLSKARKTFKWDPEWVFKYICNGKEFDLLL